MFIVLQESLVTINMVLEVTFLARFDQHNFFDYLHALLQSCHQTMTRIEFDQNYGQEIRK